MAKCDRGLHSLRMLFEIKGSSPGTSQWTSDRLWFGNRLLLTWKTSKGNMLGGDGRYDSERLVLLMSGFPSLMESEGKIKLECKIVIHAFLLYCLIVQPVVSFTGEKGPNRR
ncbi:hypothetical protein AAES_120371 [Amazona aestiva]|uniref:Uncharacterized protein n=1 Tax=Amazona aestiva TaxID=12930 RepID=A0A0Q3QY68_AMAAE|nr:hypothetical protein AAES_120371 [Amazona aestiva]